jgi:hypothetical protein
MAGVMVVVVVVVVVRGVTVVAVAVKVVVNGGGCCGVRLTEHSYVHLDNLGHHRICVGNEDVCVRAYVCVRACVYLYVLGTG